MPDTSITVENLSKHYLVGHRESGERYQSLRDTIHRNARNLARKTGDLLRGRPVIQGDTVEEFEALKDISFEVNRGEVLGIIGHNGAGKSTLLKVLSRITEPSRGRVTLRGRVASLLEVGTGFHPELSGRENIFLNGAILGMTRAEIRDRFDEIVDFAGVEAFLDTPVKRYSSGMYVRLAFSVAAHLQPEILIVDEVLAVGDAAFQRKCLGKIESVARSGRTVLFVSHNLASIQRLTDRALLLGGGRILADGATSDTIAEYHRESAMSRESEEGAIHYRVSSDQLSLERARIETAHAYVQGELRICLTFLNQAPSPEPCAVFLLLKNEEGVYATSFHSKDSGHLPSLDGESVDVHVTVASHALLPGNYTIEAGCMDLSGHCRVWGENLGELTVLPQMNSGSEFDGRTGFSTQLADWRAIPHRALARS